MAYIGNQADTAFTSLIKQDLTGASGTSLTLTHAVANANDIALYINNVRQEPVSAYSTNGTAVSLTGSVVSSDDIYVIYLARAVQTTVPPDGSVSTAKIASSAVDLTSKVTGVLPVANGGTGHSTFHPQTAIIADTKPQNTGGGTFTQDAWQTRTLNTEISDLNNICSLSSDIFTLSSGTYLIEWTAPAYNVERNQSRLYDTTNSAVIQYGASNYSSSPVQNFSVGSAIVVISSNTGYKIEHKCGSTRTSQGFGVEANMGTEVYTQVKITKIG